MKFTLAYLNNWIANKNATRNTPHYRYALKHFLISIGKNDWAKKIISSRKKPRKKVFKFVSKIKLGKIINALPKKYRPISFLQIKTGARFSEIMTLRSENIDFGINDRLIYIKIGVNKSKTKGSKERTLKISQKYEDYIRGWMVRPYGYLFLDQKCENMSEKQILTHLDTLNRYMNTELSKAGRIFDIDALSTHYLRHIFSDWFLKAGGDPVYLQQVLGHSRLDTTMGYVSIQDQMAENVLLKMEE